MVSKLNSYSDKELIRRWGEKLKRLRVDADFSQTELAVKTGMSRSSIAEIEKGRNFSIGSLISISRALNQLDKFENFLKEEEYELTPMEIYEREKKKRKRGGKKFKRWPPSFKCGWPFEKRCHLDNRMYEQLSQKVLSREPTDIAKVRARTGRALPEKKWTNQTWFSIFSFLIFSQMY